MSARSLRWLLAGVFLWTASPLTTAGEEGFLVAPVPPSHDVQLVARWVTESGDNKQLPFIILDKVQAHIFVFSADGSLVGGAPALLGLGVGDVLPKGIAGKPLSQIQEKDRITQAGRFLARKGLDSHKKEVLWVDFGSGLAIHPVVTGNAAQRRLERLNTPTPRDNRISWGCINVPADYYASTVSSTFSSNKGYVYILPETVPVAGFFGIGRAGTPSFLPVKTD